MMNLTISNLKTLNPQQLKQTKQSLEKFFYKVGMNIAVYNAERYQSSIDFRRNIEEAIEKQIKHIATVDNINTITKTINKQDMGLVVAVAAMWLIMDEALKGGDKTISEFLNFGGEQGGQAALDKMLPDRKFDFKNLELKDKLRDRTDFLLKTLDKTGTKWVASTIEEGLKAKMTNMELVKFLRDKAIEVARERAQLITETELMYSMNLVELETYRRNGIEKVKWQTAHDERVEEACLANEAAGYITLGEEFPMGVTNPPQHISCRCLLLPKLPIAIEGSIWTGV